MQENKEEIIEAEAVEVEVVDELDGVVKEELQKNIQACLLAGVEAERFSKLEQEIEKKIKELG